MRFEFAKAFADLVLVLKQGRIVERGTHTQLLEANGTYAELYRQFIRATGTTPRQTAV